MQVGLVATGVGAAASMVGSMLGMGDPYDSGSPAQWIAPAAVATGGAGALAMARPIGGFSTGDVRAIGAGLVAGSIAGTALAQTLGVLLVTGDQDGWT